MAAAGQYMFEVFVEYYIGYIYICIYMCVDNGREPVPLRPALSGVVYSECCGGVRGGTCAAAATAAVTTAPGGPATYQK